MADNTTEQATNTTAETSKSQQEEKVNSESAKNKKGSNSSDNQGGRVASAGKGGNEKRGPRKGGRGDQQRERSEFEQKVIDIRRVTRVVAGGRRFGFRVTVVVGDMKGRVGIGVDKGGDTAVAIEKAVNRAKKNMIKANLTENMSIPHEAQVKYEASELLLRPSPGRGIVAGSAVRSVMQMAGVTDVVAKLLSRSGNKLNNARAAVKALQSFSQ